MNAANPELPEMPVDLDNAFYEEMLNAVGYQLAMGATDAAWRAILRAGYTVVPVRSLVRTRSDA